jgi:hypothetical protein
MIGELLKIAIGGEGPALTVLIWLAVAVVVVLVLRLILVS